jgi:uncharacterized protein (DUF433 family)
MAKHGQRDIAININEDPRKVPNYTVVIDPKIGFGHPVLAGRGVPTIVIAQRYKAGESIASLMRDYGCEQVEIEEAIRCELHLEAA